MQEKKFVMFLIFSIFFLLLIGVYVLTYTGMITTLPWESWMKNDNPLVSDDPDSPSEYDKLDFKKKQDKLAELEEKLHQQQEQLNTRQAQIDQKEQELIEIRKGLQEERRKISLLTQDIEDRKKKIKDLANKVTSMPPEKAVEMMRRWRHSDVIDVIRQIDKDALAEDTPSLTPYLLTLFSPEERADITNKILLPNITVNQEE